MKSPGQSWGGLIKIQTQIQQKRHPGTKNILPLWVFSSCLRKTEANCLINGIVSLGSQRLGEKKNNLWFYYSVFLGQFSYHFSVSSSFLALHSIHSMAAKVGHRTRAFRPLDSSTR